MGSVGRAVAHAFSWAGFHLTGKNTLSRATTFDIVLLLLIGEAAERALVGDDHSSAEKVLGGEPLIIVVDGWPLGTG